MDDSEERFAEGLQKVHCAVIKDIKAGEKSAGGRSKGMATKEQMINYLQQMMDKVQDEIKQYGVDDRLVEHRIDAMIACKEMVEAFIQEPVNLQKDGKVTVGF